MMMQSKGQKIDCNKASEAQIQAQQQMGQGMPGCGGGGGQPGGGGQGGQGGQSGQQPSGGNNMASDCGGKAGAGQEKCTKAKKEIEGVEKSCDTKTSESEKQQCKADAKTAKEVADKGSQANQKMGTANLGQIMQMVGQLMCQMKKAQQCQKDVCSAPGQKKFDPSDPSVKNASTQGGKTEILQDDEGCLVDCNTVMNAQPVVDQAYPEWAAKANARIAKFKPMCECQMTPGLASCGGKPNEKDGEDGTPRKDKGEKRLAVENPLDPNSSDRSPGENSPSALSGRGGSGAGGTGGGAGLSLGGGGSAAKDNKRLAAPKPLEVSAGFEGGGVGGSKSSSGSSADEPLGKYKKYLPNERGPASKPAVPYPDITGAGGKSIWEKVSDAYRVKAKSLDI
jgi:hypothetical protein